jgi:endonuclease/exonuclease/phosphatase family metal-dependent hydrolase
MAEIKVAFWNLQNLFDTTASPIAADLEFTPADGWTEEALAAKLTNLAKIIKAMHGGAGPDLLGICEVENQGIAQRLLDEIGRSDYRLAHVDSPDIRGIDCALIYSTAVFHDPSPDDIRGHLVHFRFPTRDIFQVCLPVKANGADLHVFVNHWPSRRQGTAESEPHRITVAERAGQLVDEVLKLDRTAYALVPDTPAGLAELNARWNRNVLLMGDFNDDPFNRSFTDYLLAAKDIDKVEEVLKPASGRHTPTLKSYLEREPVLLNLSWPLLATPDTCSLFFSGTSANTMNLFDQFIVSRGLHFGSSGLQARAGSVEIFKHPDGARRKGSAQGLRQADQEGIQRSLPRADGRRHRLGVGVTNVSHVRTLASGL